MENERRDRRNGAGAAILELANMMSVPMSLTAAIQLNVPQAIWQAGSNVPLSATHILSKVRPSLAGSASPGNLQRILRVLASHGVFEEHLDIAGQRRYSLTDVGRTLVPDAQGLSYADYILQHHQLKAWPLVHMAVLDPSTEPFTLVNGEPPYSYYEKRPEMNRLMQKAMSGASVPFMKAMLDGYDGFSGVTRLVDAGGSAGDCLKMIMNKFPNIVQGINFDLPEVVARAPNIPGVIHVGGDVLKSVPAGDAIFMKWVLTTWSDEECKVILSNCYKALPVGGKLIVCEPVIPSRSDDSHRTRALLGADIFIMTMYNAQGKHRTEDEFRHLGHSVGFLNFRALCLDYYFTVIESRMFSFRYAVVVSCFSMGLPPYWLCLVG